MAGSELELAALLVSRICHDLVSPVGAVVNGIELLSDDQDPELLAQALPLLENSARQASYRLQFYRLAFGGMAGAGDELEITSVIAITQNLFEDSKVRVIWQSPPQSAGKQMVKLLLNLVLVAAESLPAGGEITVELPAENGLELAVRARSERILMSRERLDALVGNPAISDIEPRNAPAYYAGRLAAELALGVTCDQPDGNSLQLTVSAI